MAYRFEWNERLRIPLPALDTEWHELEPAEQALVVEQWELIRGTIPDLVKELERVINRKQDRLSEEDSFEESCRLNAEIADCASRINDLHIWYRIDQELETRRHS